jgi:hypothetical protein
MKNLYDPASVQEIKQRIALLRPDSQHLWGTMSSAQAMAHCATSMEWAVGDRIPEKASLLLRLLGRAVKPLALGNEQPMRRNSPTAKELVVREERNLATEQERLGALIDRFSAAGPPGCTSHPHSFFGRLTAEEWAELTYKHLDHHLRQFGV